MSSFRRAAPRAPAAPGVSTTSSTGLTPVASTTAAVKRALPGTKPFLNGQTLISTGLSQLDAIVGGGWLLGTIVLVDVPRQETAAASSSLVDDLHRYFLAEGVVSGQAVVVVADDSPAFVAQQLPLELSMAQKQVKAQLAATTLEHTDSEQLTIAWQYQKYMADATSDKARFCHSFDLSRRMHAELLYVNAPVTLDLVTHAETAVDTAYVQLFADIQRHVESRSASQVVRLSIRELGSPLLGPPTSDHMTALFSFVRRLRHLAASSSGRNVVIQLSGHFYAFPIAFANELRHLSDYVVEVKSFMGESDMLPGELVEFNGLLEIKKLARTHALACHSLDAVKFGIKRERRKMKIEKFHLPPEGSRSSNDKDRKAKSTTSSAPARSNLVSPSFTRASKGSVGCGSGVLTEDPLDF